MKKTIAIIQNTETEIGSTVRVVHECDQIITHQQSVGDIRFIALANGQTYLYTDGKWDAGIEYKSGAPVALQVVGEIGAILFNNHTIFFGEHRFISTFPLMPKLEKTSDAIFFMDDRNNLWQWKLGERQPTTLKQFTRESAQFWICNNQIFVARDKGLYKCAMNSDLELSLIGHFENDIIEVLPLDGKELLVGRDFLASTKSDDFRIFPDQTIKCIAINGRIIVGLQRSIEVINPTTLKTQETFASSWNKAIIPISHNQIVTLTPGGMLQLSSLETGKSTPLLESVQSIQLTSSNTIIAVSETKLYEIKLKFS